MAVRIRHLILRPTFRIIYCFSVSILRKPDELLKPTEYRQRKLAKMYHFECKCKSCALNFPPINPRGLILSADFYQLFDSVGVSTSREAVPLRFISKSGNRQFLKFEKTATAHLQRNEHFHPSTETLVTQYMLMLAWNMLGRWTNVAKFFLQNKIFQFL